ncbi:MAG: hypothetical protein ACOYL3_00280 [Desulfuromonadaceae bacterium]
MGIDAITMDWLTRLKSKGLFDHRTHMLELGPQDLFFVPPEHLKSRIEMQQVTFNYDDFFQSGTYKPFAQRAFYNILGISEYTCSDVADSRSHYYLDLNKPIKCVEKKYDIITNFGTFEHVFNIGQAFVTIDQLIADDGVILHALPAMGDINHGFWNIHPTVYYDVARDNGYEIMDLCYVDNMCYRQYIRNQESNHDKPLDFDSLPIKINCSHPHIKFSQANPNFITQASLQLLNNSVMPETRSLWGTHPSLLFDCCFVAMRKISMLNERNFVYPYQSF